ncbi:MAG: preprotein translocase subunit SecE [Deltaproteobacteria bacterium]|nr:preprotein translocase subunit SecE [Deltaproteobacteria bacterium]MBW1953172.1 preprotein translocase subunit SecE [Deltaproteobacteria bacterium]MBW1987376.1 preprotein translocase subunit SecE [Deltaproteobacteria bacterium]MBW2135524.1 preprotein translocase subunit SecE [Deltaproteobacteria bacterium]
MKKTKTKEKANPKVQVKGGKEVAKKVTKGQVVKLGGKKKKSSKLSEILQYWRQTKQFFNEAVIELKKVTWPGRKETLGATAVVIILVVFISVFLGIVDLGLSRLVSYIIG